MPIDDMFTILDEEINARIRYATLGYSQGGRMVLGGTSGSGGGSGGPPGGFIGQLAQRYSTYDLSEDATLSGSGSLVDNLNHIRYRIQSLEGTVSGGVASDFISLTDTPETYIGQAGKFLRVTTEEDGVEFADNESGGEGICLMHSADITWYPITASGLLQAVEDATPGDTVIVPPAYLETGTVVLQGINLTGNLTTLSGSILATDAVIKGITCSGISLTDTTVSDGTFITVDADGIRSNAKDISVYGDVSADSGDLYVYNSVCLGNLDESDGSTSPILVDYKDIVPDLPEYTGANTYYTYIYNVLVIGYDVFYSLSRYAYYDTTLLAREGFIIKAPLSYSEVSTDVTYLKLSTSDSIPLEMGYYGDYLYVVDTFSFTIINHTTMTEMDTYTQEDHGWTSSKYQQSLSVSYPYVYVTGTCGFVVYNVADPSGITADYVNTTLHGEVVRYSDGYVYISSYDGYIRILDVASPDEDPSVSYNTKLFTYGSGSSFNQPSSMSISGTLAAFCVERKNKICLMDVTDRASPTQLSLFDSGFVFDGVGHIDFHIFGEYLVCTLARSHYSGDVTSTKLVIFDISDTSDPTIIYNQLVVDESGGSIITAHSEITGNYLIINSGSPQYAMLVRLITPQGRIFLHSVVLEE